MECITVHCYSLFLFHWLSSPYYILCFQALEVAGQVAGTAVSTSPLPYNTMTSQCEALGTCARKKLSNWLAYENHDSHAADKSLLALPENGNLALEKV